MDRLKSLKSTTTSCTTCGTNPQQIRVSGVWVLDNVRKVENINNIKKKSDCA